VANSRSNIHLQASPPGNVIFVGIGVLLLVGIIHESLAQTILTLGSQVIKGTSSIQDKLIDNFRLKTAHTTLIRALAVARAALGHS
jgi:hypothetical protein